MSCKSVLYEVTTTSTSVAATTGIIPLTNIVRRYGCAINQSGNSIVLNEPGYYQVSVQVTFSAPAAGVIGLTLQQDGTQVLGATGAETITTATTEVRSISFTAIVRVTCGNAPSTLTLVNSGLAATYTNVALSIEKVI